MEDGVMLSVVRGLVKMTPGPDEGALVARIAGDASTTARRYKDGSWVVPLARDVIDSLIESGVDINSSREIGSWERRDRRLDGARDRARALMHVSVDELRQRLVDAGVVFHGPERRDHQIRAIAYALTLQACGLFLDTGTGKTAVAASVMQTLHDIKGRDRFLVIAPKSILDVGWYRDMTTFSRLRVVNASSPPTRTAVRECPVCGRVFKSHVSWSHLKTHALDGEGVDAARSRIYDRWPEVRPRSSESRAEAILRVFGSRDYDCFLINPEAFRAVADEDLGTWDLVVVDESSMLKSPGAKITKAVVALGASARRRMVMTATPRPNGSLDLWGQMAFIDQSLGANFAHFREKYFYRSYNGYTWLPKTRRVDSEIWDIVSGRSIRYRLEDCVDLPGETLETMSVDLTPDLRAAYDEMVKKMQVTLASGEVVDTEWSLVQAMKLSQITSGYIFDNDGKARFIGGSPKIKATVDMASRLIESEGRSVVIWVRYPATEGREIEEGLKKFGVSTLHGGTRDVSASVGAFLSKKNRVMIAHVLSAKFGHTWTVSNVAIFHSYDYSWENFYQAKRRIYRLGQKKPVTYVVNVARDTVDEDILEAVFRKESASDVVVDAATLMRRVYEGN